jgi:hypothetical protein
VTPFRPRSQRFSDSLTFTDGFISQLRPEIDFSAELGPPIVRDSWKDEPVPLSAGGKNTTTWSFHQSPVLSTPGPLARDQTTASTSLPVLSDDGGASSDEDDPASQLIQSFGRLTLLDRGPHVKANRLLDAAYRFHGKSTTFSLVIAAREARATYLLESIGADTDSIANEIEHIRESGHKSVRAIEEGLRRRDYWHSPDVSIHSRSEVLSFPLSLLIFARKLCRLLVGTRI